MFVNAFNVVPEVSETVLNSFFSFFFLYSAPQQLFPLFYLPAHLSIILLLIPSSVFFISFIVLFISVCLFFGSSRSVKHFLYPLSPCLHSFFFQERSWMIFTIITLNSFSGRLPVSSSFSCSCRLDFYLVPSSAAYFFVISFYLTDLLCLWPSFCTVQDRSSSCLWCLPPGG